MFTELIGMTVTEATQVLTVWGEGFDLFTGEDETVLSVMTDGAELFVTDGVIDRVDFMEEF